MRALVVYNFFSGRSKAAKKLSYICEKLKTKYDIVECFKSIHPKSITEHITTCHIDYDLVVVLGGDGSVHEIVNGIMQLENKPSLAYIPMGTCNDAAHTIGFGKNIKKSINKILDGNSAKIDVFKINDSYFIYGVAAGCLTEISYDTSHEIKKNIGKLAYFFQGAKAYKKTQGIHMYLESDSRNEEGDFSVFLGLNSRYLAGFKIHRKKRIYLNDGKLRLTLIRKTKKLVNVFDFAMFLIFGEAYHHNIIHLDSSHFKLSCPAETAFNTDGESFGKKNEINVEVVREAINLISTKRVIKRHFLTRGD